MTTPITDGTIQTVVNDWIADDSALEFTDPDNVPFYGLINSWNVTAVTDMSEIFKNKTTFNNI